jgi:hypothetical protein
LPTAASYWQHFFVDIIPVFLGILVGIGKD